MSDLVKGPYTAHNNGQYWQVDDKNGEQVGDACAAMFDGTENADGSSKKDWSRSEAVARLFSASPDLLKHLAAFVRLADEKIKNPEMVWPTWETPLLIEARAAVAKAEGHTI